MSDGYRIRADGIPQTPAQAIIFHAPEILDRLLHAIEVVDAHLDAAAPRVFRVCPGDSGELAEAKTLLNRYRRLAAGPVSESVEAVDALNLATGGNPRKGVIGGDEEILGECGDTAVAALLAIQSITKDVAATWTVFEAALAKAESRVP